MKWTGGPIIATAVVRGLQELDNATPDELRQTTLGYLLYDDDAYWQTVPPRLFGVTIYLRDEEWLDEPLEPATRSRGSSWIVLDTPERVQEWLSGGQPSQAPQPVAAQRRSIPLSLRFKVFRRDNFACTYCGQRPPQVELQLDHVVPWSKGGPDTEENLRTACNECNQGKGARQL